MPLPTGSSSLRERVARIVAAEIAPASQMDGADIEVLEVKNGIVRVRLQGACSCCPSTIMAVMIGVEQELRRQVPGVEYLEVVS